MHELDLLQRIAIWLLPVLFAITLHEAAHGYAAMRLGDRTAELLGRLSLNPVKHIDPIGTVLLPALLFFTGGFLFGWAKPVPVAINNLHHPKRDMALVAVAGPLSNLLMGLFWVLVIHIAMLIDIRIFSISLFLVYAGVAGIFINTILMLLNLLPIPPLDGGRVVTGLLPDKLSMQFSRIEPYGLILLIILLVTGQLAKVLWPMVTWVVGLFAQLAGLEGNSYNALLYNLMGG